MAHEADMGEHGLFPRLLGNLFGTLAPAVRRAHGGHAVVLRGRANVERGRHPLARVVGWLARLPAAQHDGPIEVHISPEGNSERWTRRFGSSAPMISTLRAGNGVLVEKLGAATLEFRLVPQNGSIDWQLVAIRGLGVPLPIAWFRVASLSGADGARYRFLVDAQVRGIGCIVRYEGYLDAD
jgi:hypothetical protein